MSFRGKLPLTKSNDDPTLKSLHSSELLSIPFMRPFAENEQTSGGFAVPATQRASSGKDRQPTHALLPAVSSSADELEYASTIPSLTSTELRFGFHGETQGKRPLGRREASSSTIGTESFALEGSSSHHLAELEWSGTEERRADRPRASEDPRRNALPATLRQQAGEPSAISAQGTRAQEIRMPVESVRSISVMDKMFRRAAVPEVEIGSSKSRSGSLREHNNGKSISGQLRRIPPSNVRGDGEANKLRSGQLLQRLPVAGFRGTFVSTVVRAPELSYTPIDFSRWSMELMSMLFNGARREIRDLYDILVAMQFRLQHLTRRDIKLLYQWFDDFVSYINQVFNVLERVIFPHLESFIDFEGKMEGAARTSSMSRIMQKASKVKLLQPTFFELGRRDPKAFVNLVYTVEDLCRSLLRTMQQIEADVSQYRMEENFVANSKAWLDTCFQNYVFRESTPQMLIPVMLRWMDESEIQHWVENNLMKRFRKALLPVWQRTLEKKHLRIVEHFVH